nr:MAG TPA: hypothetical protein [Bacteriophage sp.]
MIPFYKTLDKHNFICYTCYCNKRSAYTPLLLGIFNYILLKVVVLENNAYNNIKEVINVNDFLHYFTS